MIVLLCLAAGWQGRPQVRGPAAGPVVSRVGQQLSQPFGPLKSDHGPPKTPEVS